MIQVSKKQDCCGCSACVQRCPRHCISMKEDAEGFLYPDVDMTQCIDCGICEKVCPWLNLHEKSKIQDVLGAKNIDRKERMESSSGGVFIALAKKVIENGGVVFGAVFNECWEVVHTYAENLKDVKSMMGSKYMQSRMENSYREAEGFLKRGRTVLFTGCPCQITGLHNYLGKEYHNLISVDFLCHGVPSPGVWRKYLTEVSTSFPKEINGISLDFSTKITGIDFRNKQQSGWKNFYLTITGLSNGTEKVLLSDKHKNNPFMKGFLGDLYLRPSCYNCKCKNGASHSDLTIADFWGISSIMPDFDDDKGVSLVLVNTDKGRNVLALCDLEIRKSTLDDARRFNGGFKETVIIPPKRDAFFHHYNSGYAISPWIDKELRIPMKMRMVDKMWNTIIILKSIIKKYHKS